jgi:hypothetical protein
MHSCQREGDQGVVSPVSRQGPVWASAGALALVVALISGPGGALADKGNGKSHELTITQRPQISGTAQVGQTLASTPGAWDGKPPPTATYLWLRCSASPPDETRGDSSDNPDNSGKSGKSNTCTSIAGATGLSYVPVGADVGYTLRMLLTVSNNSGETSDVSDPTSAVGAPAPAPVAARPPVLDPFPVVRIRGRATQRGARITLLTVRAPRGARVRVGCSGTGCPIQRWAHTAALTRVRAFEHELPAGVRLTVTVTQRGRIGKYTAFVIRRGRPPLRRDRCLYPGSARPRSCPS